MSLSRLIETEALRCCQPIPECKMLLPKDYGEIEASLKQGKGFNMRAMDILLVDDDNDYLHLLSMLLKGEGFQVAAASDGIHALQLMRHINFRMMITDFCMPKMNGLELATKVKEQHPGTPVVLMTGNAISDLIESAFVAGISKVFSKPLDLQRLLSFIRPLLRARQNCVLGERPLARGFQKLVGC